MLGTPFLQFLAAVVGVLSGAMVLVGCGDTQRLDRQEAQARARSCASLIERRQGELFDPDPARVYAAILERSGPQRFEATAEEGRQPGRFSSNVVEFLAACKAPPASSPVANDD